MKAVVNGIEAELNVEPEVQIEEVLGRLLVKTSSGSHSALAVRKGDRVLISYRGQVYEIEAVGAGRTKSTRIQSGVCLAPMPGLIVEVLAQVGDRVTAGQKLLVLEAMKMQQPITASIEGVLVQLNAEPGKQVKEGEILAKVEPDL